MLEASRTVPYPRKALKPLRGLQWVMFIALTIEVYMLFITFTCLAWSAGMSSQPLHPGERLELIFSTGFRVAVDSKSGKAQPRSRAQFGVVPHLITNFRVSRTPNRRTALPWQRLTAKSTVYSLIGAPNNQSSWQTAGYSSLFQHARSQQQLNLWFSYSITKCIGICYTCILNPHVLKMGFCSKICY